MERRRFDSTPTDVGTIRHVDDAGDALTIAQFDELDLAVLHALQIDARAPWTRIAAATGADATTVARHWADLRERSLAWLTIWPTPRRWAATTDLALVLVDASPETAGRIAARPEVLSLDATSAGYLALIASRGGLGALGDRVRSLGVEGTRVIRMDVAASVAAEDSGWRLRALSPAQQRIMRDGAPSGGRAPRAEQIAELAEALEDDPRMPAAVVATRLGVSEATARRALDGAQAAGLLRIGCDVAMPAAGLRRGAILWGRTTDPAAASARIAHHPAVHRVATLVGPAPLYIAARATSLAALPEIERGWGADVEIVDRWTVLRPLKRNGHLLDAAGRSTGRVAPRW